MVKIANQTVGKRIKALRKAANITQEELAKQLFLSRSCIANYEVNKRNPDIVIVQRVADHFNVTLNYLMGSEDSDAVEKELQVYESEISQYFTDEGHLDISALLPAQRIALIEYFLFLKNKSV